MNITYRVYARKSSEAEDRQALSISSQVSEAKKLSALRGIDLKDEDILNESRSAKSSFDRPVFEQLVKSIEKGGVQAIIAWHPNRLSRNAVDTGRLVELLDHGKLVEIITQQQTFKNTPADKFFFTMLCSQAKMENDNKSIDVRRGLRKKYEIGFPAGVAKIGYVNDYGKKGQRRILEDPQRFSLVKQLWEAFLIGKYSVRRLLEYSDKILGLKTIQRAKEGGKPMKLSRLYDMLKDPFYAGFFFVDDENGTKVRYQVNDSVPRIITEEQFWQVQMMLGNKGRPRTSVNKKSFAYIGRIRCGSCGGWVTAEHKHQLICSSCKLKFAYSNKTKCPKCEIAIGNMEDPTYLHYIYYHCTKRRNPDCPEGAIQESLIDQYMANHLEENLKISPELRDWCIENLEELSVNDRENELGRKVSWDRQKTEKQKEYDELIKMKMKNLLDDAEFLRLKASVQKELETINKALSETNDTENNRIQEAEKAFNMAVGITEIFRIGTFEEKTEALGELGSNLILKGKKLEVSDKKLITIISDYLLMAKTENRAFEPGKTRANKEKSEVFSSVSPTLLRG